MKRKRNIRNCIKTICSATILAAVLSQPLRAQETPEFYILNQPQLEQIVDNDPDVFRYFRTHPGVKNIKAGYASGCNTLYLMRSAGEATDENTIEKFKLETIFADFFENKLKKKDPDLMVIGDENSCRPLILTSNPCTGININEVKTLIATQGGNVTINVQIYNASPPKGEQGYDPRIGLFADIALARWAIPTNPTETAAIKNTVLALEEKFASFAEHHNYAFPNTQGEDPILRIGMHIPLHNTRVYNGNLHISSTILPLRQKASIRFDINSESYPSFSWEYVYDARTWLVQTGYLGVQRLGSNVNFTFGLGGTLGITSETYDIRKLTSTDPPQKEFIDIHQDHTTFEPGAYISFGLMPRISKDTQLGIEAEYLLLKTSDPPTTRRTSTKLALRLRRDM